MVNTRQTLTLTHNPNPPNQAVENCRYPKQAKKKNYAARYVGVTGQD